MQMQQETLAEFIQEGDHFRVTTEKVMSLLPGCPVGDRVTKRSTYSIIVRGALAAEAAKYGCTVETPDWAVPSDKFDGIVEHRSRPELYVLAGLDKKAGFCGRPEFYIDKEVAITDDGDVTQCTVERVLLDSAQAAEVKKYLPQKGSFGASFALPLRSIVEIDAPGEKEDPVMVSKREKDLPF